MNHKQFLHWLEQIYATTPAEIDCDQFQALLPAYVDFEIAGESPGSRLPQVKAHLAQCRDCAEEYEGLRAVAKMDAEGRLPEAEEILTQFAEEPAPEPKAAEPTLP